MRFVAQGGTLWVIPADDAVGHTETPGTPQIAESDWLPASSRIGRSIRTGLGNVHIQKRANWQVPTGNLPPIPLVADEQGRDIVSATPIGNGSVIVCQIGLSSRWSNLAVQPTALPLMHEIARFASERNQWLSNVDVGKLSPRDLDQLRASKAASAGSKSVLGLDYERHASRFVGVYELAKPSERASAENTIAAPLTAIRLAPGAGKLVPSDTSLYDRIADSLNADTVLADDGASKVRLTGYPLWTAVMLLFAIVLLAEGALANPRRAAATVTAKLGSKC
jgi:hypothetical protein